MREQAIELRKLGLSIKEIAGNLGKCTGTVYSWVKDVPLSQEIRDKLSKRGYETANKKRFDDKKIRIEALNLTPMTASKCDGNYDPKGIGDRSEARIIAEFLDSGMDILIPFGDRNRYDLVVDENGTFLRIQCKTARLIGDRFLFKTESNNWNSGKRKDYKNDIDFFAVFLRENRKVYIFSPEKLPKSTCTVRLDERDVSNKGRYFAVNHEFIPGKSLKKYTK